MSFVQQGVVGSSSGGSIPVVISGNSTLASGSKTVTTAGSRVQLSAISIPCKKITLQALAVNTGVIYIGDSTVSSANGYSIYPTQSFTVTPSNLNLVWIDSSVNGEGIIFLYEN